VAAEIYGTCCTYCCRYAGKRNIILLYSVMAGTSYRPAISGSKAMHGKRIIEVSLVYKITEL
jgi:hypothetical protein